LPTGLLEGLVGYRVILDGIVATDGRLDEPPAFICSCAGETIENVDVVRPLASQRKLSQGHQFVRREAMIVPSIDLAWSWICKPLCRAFSGAHISHNFSRNRRRYAFKITSPSDFHRSFSF